MLWRVGEMSTHAPDPASSTLSLSVEGVSTQLLTATATHHLGVGRPHGQAGGDHGARP